VRSWKVYIAERQDAKHVEHDWLFLRWPGSVGREHELGSFWSFEKGERKTRDMRCHLQQSEFIAVKVDRKT
jgi:hypothetical protein